MKKTKLVIYLTEVLCFITVIFSAYMMLGGDRFNKAVRIYAVVQNSDDNENRVLKNGMRDAARDEGIELIVVDTVRMPDTDSQIEVVNREVPKDADAIVIEPAPGVFDPDNYKGITDKNNIVFLRNDISQGNSDYKGIGPDNTGIIKDLLNGAGLADSYVNNKKVLVICENADTFAIRERIDSLLSELGRDLRDITIREIDKTTDESILLNDFVKNDIIFALDNKSTLTIGDISALNTIKPKTYGIANSAEAVYLLEKNMFICLAAINDYNLGYKSVLEAIKTEKKEFDNKKANQKSYYILTKENLYSEENDSIIKNLSR